MSEKELKNCNCGNHEDGHDCDCGDDCECDTITLDMEDGTQKDFLVLDTLEYEGKNYIALAEVETMEYDILRMNVVGETVELNVIEDDAEFEAVAAKFDELFNLDDEEEEEEEE